jgi:predicted P-loop ATPase
LCIAAALDGKPVRSVLALVGGQNSGKTEWFRRLLPNELKKYYAESKLDAGKDDDILMCQKLIVMDDEMGGKSKQDEKRFKELTSKQVFSLRAPYARSNEDFKRLAVLCGTSNDREVINDPTGNTRIFPVNVISINHAKYNSINKDELFIEIMKLYESGENHELTKDELIQLGLVSDRHTTLAIEEEAINRFFRKPSEMPNIRPVMMNAFMIKTHIESYSTTKLTNGKRLSQYLTKIFGESMPIRIDGKQIRCYEVVKIDHTHLQINETDTQEVDSMPF